MDATKRAETALRLLTASIAGDDQDATDFLADIIERDAIYRHYEDDTGNPITCMADFAAAMHNDGAPVGTRPLASAGSTRPLCRMTPAERYADRQARRSKT